ncbi:C40 family peptidase [Shimia sediminis]|uniref:C40 family peptidase n=1 Tax=Shimia sediminis TaxID=2497945 RepID=UPI000F8F4EF5|nr:NlpC/P60 family protein [Shimia sediminis]
MDRRFLPANDRVAHSGLEGAVQSPVFTDGTLWRICVPVADLLSGPGQSRDKQLRFGQGFTVLEFHQGWAFGFDPVDDYAGYIKADYLTQNQWPTHRVRTRATHAYTSPDFKSQDLMFLSFFSELCVDQVEGGFAKTPAGWVPDRHLAPLSWVAEDPVAIAEMCLGSPYLWGGDSACGIDCSGLVQLAFHAAGRACPRDSDLQEASFPDATGGYARGDLLFWKGHVALVVDAETLIHANAHHMAVVHENIETAIARIEKQGDGPVTSHKRPSGKDLP